MIPLWTANVEYGLVQEGGEYFMTFEQHPDQREQGNVHQRFTCFVY